MVWFGAKPATSVCRFCVFLCLDIDSKRCDYENIFKIQKNRNFKFQFQKVRLWVAPIKAAKKIGELFQFQKVRLWACGYFSALNCSLLFQFQKVRLWAVASCYLALYMVISIPKGAIMSEFTENAYVVLVYFNSKRCDYELKLKPLLSSSSIIFQFQKVRLWDNRNTILIKLSSLFQFQKVRLWAIRYLKNILLIPKFQFQKVRLWDARRDL